MILTLFAVVQSVESGFKYKYICFWWKHFHRIGSLGWFDLVVAICVCLSDVPFHVVYLRPIFPLLPEVGCSKNLEIGNPWGKALERSGLRIEHFCWEVVYNRRIYIKIFLFFCWFCLILRWRTGVEPILLHAWTRERVNRHIFFIFLFI